MLSKMQKTIYILGNKLVRSDNLGVKLLPKLRRKFKTISFKHFDPTEEIDSLKDKKLIFIDPVVGIDDVYTFSGLDNFDKSPRFSVHDYDLLLNLMLMKKLGKIKDFLIIGVPSNGKVDEVFEKVVRIFSANLL